VGEGRRGRADTGRDPADMLFAVHVAVWGSALYSMSSRLFLSNPHHVSSENSTAWACWCMRADFVRPADRVG